MSIYVYVGVVLVVWVLIPIVGMIQFMRCRHGDTRMAVLFSFMAIWGVYTLAMLAFAMIVFVGGLASGTL